MNVQELVEQLIQFPPDMEVYTMCVHHSEIQDIENVCSGGEASIMLHELTIGEDTGVFIEIAGVAWDPKEFVTGQ